MSDATLGALRREPPGRGDGGHGLQQERQVPSTGTGILTGYEIGNQEDFGELRKHRPG